MTNNSAYPLTNYEGLKFTPGQAVDVKVSRTFYSNLDWPFSSCRKDTTTAYDSDSDLYKRTLKLNKYSLELCYDLCLQRDFIVKQCLCSDPMLFQYDPNAVMCKTNASLSCVKSVKDKFDSQKISDKCSSYCPTPCDTIKYNTILSSSNYPTDYYFNILAASNDIKAKYKAFLDSKGTNNLSAYQSVVHSSILKVNVFYDDLYYINIQDTQSVTVDTLFGNIGNLDN